MTWVKWDSIEDFSAWHEDIKTELGLPKLSIDQEGNIIADSVINENYVVPVIVADNDIRADIADEYASGLSVSVTPHVSNYEAAPK